MKRLNLLAHVIGSAGWWGAVAAFLGLAVAGMKGDAVMACRAMAVTGWAAIAPLAVVSVVTGVAQSLGSGWGLVRHWWLVFKMVITLPCSVLLVLHLGMLDVCTAATAKQMTVDAVLALIVLLIPLALSVYKPRGVTPWTRKI